MHGSPCNHTRLHTPCTLVTLCIWLPLISAQNKATRTLAPPDATTLHRCIASGTSHFILLCLCSWLCVLPDCAVQSVCIRLKRPVDSDSLSLTHIGIYGVATFSCSLSFSNATPMGKTTSLISSLPLTHVYVVCSQSSLEQM